MQLVSKEQNGTIFPLFPRKLAAKFLGVAASNFTNDCKLLGIEKHSSGMTPEEVFTLWGYRVMFVHLHPTSTRTQVAKKIRQQPKTSLKELNKAGYTFEMFCQQLKIFIESNYEIITPLQLNRPERESLKEYRAKQEQDKIKNNRLYLTRREAARLLNCSLGLVCKMLRALDCSERSLITERVFAELVELRAKTVLWRRQFKNQPKKNIKARRKDAAKGRTLIMSNFLYRPSYARILKTWKYNTRGERDYLNRKLEKIEINKLAQQSFNSVVSRRGEVESIDFDKLWLAAI
jgi:hypothetical protein